MEKVFMLFLSLSFIVLQAKGGPPLLPESLHDTVSSEQYVAQPDELQEIYEPDGLNTDKVHKQLYTALILSCCIFCIVLFIMYVTHTKRIRQKNRIIVERIQEQIQRERELRRIKQEELSSHTIEDTHHPNANPETSIIAGTDFNREKRLISQLCCWLNENKRFTQSDLNRKLIADALGTNEKYLADAIRNQCDGQTVSDYINSLRLAYACDLLTSDFEMTIEAVAGEVGISNRSTLFRLFRKHYGISPSEYRDTQKNKFNIH